MKYKYGEYSQEQLHSYKAKLHSKVHWLLIYKENKYPQLDNYFSSIQFQLDGLNELLDCPELITLMSLLEAARMEAQKPDCNYSTYRKAVFDAHTMIDRLPEVDGDANG